MSLRGFYGFDTLSDLFRSLGFCYDWLAFKISLITIATITSFITTYMYDDSKAIFILIFLFLCDFITGVWKSIIKKNFNSYKMIRILPMFISAMLILSIAWNLSGVMWVYSYLPGIVYVFISSTLFVSLIENLGEIGIIDRELINIIKNRFNFKTLIKKIDEKNVSDNEENQPTDIIN